MAVWSFTRRSVGGGAVELAGICSSRCLKQMCLDCGAAFPRRARRPAGRCPSWPAPAAPLFTLLPHTLGQPSSPGPALLHQWGGGPAGALPLHLLQVQVCHRPWQGAADGRRCVAVAAAAERDGWVPPAACTSWMRSTRGGRMLGCLQGRQLILPHLIAAAYCWSYACHTADCAGVAAAPHPLCVCVCCSGARVHKRRAGDEPQCAALRPACVLASGRGTGAP